MKKTGCIFFLMVLLMGCIKETRWDITPADQNLVVVNAIITDEIGSQAVTLSYPVSNLNETPSPVTGANVLITEVDSVYQLTEEPENSGIYITSKHFLARPGKTYTLQVYHRDQFYTAKSAMVEGFTFNPFLYSKNTGDPLYHIDYVASVFSTENPAMWEILLDWSDVPGFEGQDSLKCRARVFFYTLPTLDVSEIFAPEVEKVSFPAGTSVTEKRYSLSPAHAEFVREMLLETNWQGGIFNSAPANVTTNMSKGAIGFFAACSVNTSYFFIVP
jgi:hypothetical protein